MRIHLSFFSSPTWDYARHSSEKACDFLLEKTHGLWRKIRPYLVTFYCYCSLFFPQSLLHSFAVPFVFINNFLVRSSMDRREREGQAQEQELKVKMQESMQRDLKKIADVCQQKETKRQRIEELKKTQEEQQKKQEQMQKRLEKTRKENSALEARLADLRLLLNGKKFSPEQRAAFQALFRRSTPSPQGR